MIRLICFLLLTSYASIVVAADRSTGAELVSKCTFAHPQTTNDERGVYCLEYIAGFVDSMVLVRRTNGDAAALFCPPQDYTVGKALLAVMVYANANPESMQTDVSVFINRALRAAFPCPAKN